MAEVDSLRSQIVRWEQEWLDLLAGRGFRVIVMDNRDVGLSTWFDHQVGLYILNLKSKSMKETFLYMPSQAQSLNPN